MRPHGDAAQRPRPSVTAAAPKSAAEDAPEPHAAGRRKAHREIMQTQVALLRVRRNQTKPIQLETLSIPNPHLLDNFFN